MTIRVLDGGIRRGPAWDAEPAVKSPTSPLTVRRSPAPSRGRPVPPRPLGGTESRSLVGDHRPNPGRRGVRRRTVSPYFGVPLNKRGENLSSERGYLGTNRPNWSSKAAVPALPGDPRGRPSRRLPLKIMRRRSSTSGNGSSSRCPLCGTAYRSKHSARHRVTLQDESVSAEADNLRIAGQLCAVCWEQLRLEIAHSDGTYPTLGGP